MQHLKQYINNNFVSEREILSSGGKVVYKVNDIERLKRFIFLGSENGTLHITKDTLTKQNLDCLERLLKEKKYTEISNVINEYQNKVYKKDYILFVLARCCSIKTDLINKMLDQNDESFKVRCFELTFELCKIPTNLFMFIELYETVNKAMYNTTGWNTKLKRMITKWYNTKSLKDLMYHITKYQNRNNWTHRDVLRLSHVKTSNTDTNTVYKYIAKGKETVFADWGLDFVKFSYLIDFESLKTETNKETVLKLIVEHSFVREHIPTTWLNDIDIWYTLLQKMPMTAMLRNLNKMTAISVFDQKEDAVNIVLNKLSENSIIQSKVHPLQILISLKMYNSGKGEKGSLIWKPVQKIVGALDKAFYYSFKNVESTGKRILLALDVSGSMGWSNVCGINCLTAAEVATAMSMVIDSQETNVTIMGFANVFKQLNISSSRRLDDNLKSAHDNNFGSTDCSLPFTWAENQSIQFDTIIVFTDDDTNFNKIKPSVALQNYRKKMKLNTKLIVVGLASNEFSICDPSDNNSLEITGFDATTPLIINEFIKGTF